MDLWQAFCKADQQSHLAEPVDLPRDSAGEFVDGTQGVFCEDRLLGSDGRQSMSDVFGGLRFRQRLESAGKGESFVEPVDASQHAEQFRAAPQDQCEFRFSGAMQVEQRLKRFEDAVILDQMGVVD